MHNGHIPMQKIKNEKESNEREKASADDFYNKNICPYTQRLIRFGVHIKNETSSLIEYDMHAFESSGYILTHFSDHLTRRSWVIQNQTYLNKYLTNQEIEHYLKETDLFHQISFSIETKDIEFQYYLLNSIEKETLLDFKDLTLLILKNLESSEIFIKYFVEKKKELLFFSSEELGKTLDLLEFIVNKKILKEEELFDIFFIKILIKHDLFSFSKKLSSKDFEKNFAKNLKKMIADAESFGSLKEASDLIIFLYNIRNKDFKSNSNITSLLLKSISEKKECDQKIISNLISNNHLSFEKDHILSIMQEIIKTDNELLFDSVFTNYSECFKKTIILNDLILNNSIKCIEIFIQMSKKTHDSSIEFSEALSLNISWNDCQQEIYKLLRKYSCTSPNLKLFNKKTTFFLKSIEDNNTYAVQLMILDQDLEIYQKNQQDQNMLFLILQQKTFDMFKILESKIDQKHVNNIDINQKMPIYYCLLNPLKHEMLGFILESTNTSYYAQSFENVTLYLKKNDFNFNYFLKVKEKNFFTSKIKGCALCFGLIKNPEHVLEPLLYQTDLISLLNQWLSFIHYLPKEIQIFQKKAVFSYLNDKKEQLSEDMNHWITHHSPTFISSPIHRYRSLSLSCGPLEHKPAHRRPTT